MKIFLLFLLISSSSAIRLQCAFSHGSWGPIDTSYTCLVIGMDFSDDPIRVTGYDGNHLAGFSAEDVGGIMVRCNNTILQTVPQGLLSIFPNFITINHDGCHGINLSGNELVEYPNLQGFGTMNSILDRIPGNLFHSTPNLKVAGFTTNLITRVGIGLLDHLTMLEEAMFSNNICINQNAWSRAEIPGLIEALRMNCGDARGRLMKNLKSKLSRNNEVINFWK